MPRSEGRNCGELKRLVAVVASASCIPSASERGVQRKRRLRRFWKRALLRMKPGSPSIQPRMKSGSSGNERSATLRAQSAFSDQVCALLSLSVARVLALDQLYPRLSPSSGSIPP